MNKRIYFLDKFLDFTDEATYKVSAKEFKLILEDFVNDAYTHSFQFPSSQFEELMGILKKELKYIVAAGGLIQKNDQFLMIKRLGKWDLPKGKLDKGETIESCAIRECEEECAVKKLTIIRPINSTFHIYPLKKTMAIKESFWFYMQTDYDLPLIPQTEENIEEVKWFYKDEIINQILPGTYYTIQEVLNGYFGL
jgi:8-oxo-dGTP pyrophosphatase MutT (NUDIX family)